MDFQSIVVEFYFPPQMKNDQNTPPDYYDNKNNKILDFLIRFFAIGVFGGILTAIIPFGIILHIVAIFYFFEKRKYISIGIISFLAAGILLGLLLIGGCFFLMSNGNLF